MEIAALRCKYCGSPHIIRYGTFRGIQRWWCKNCQRKFVDNNALPGMKTDYRQVGSALSMFYEGMSLNAIRRHLNQMHSNYPSDSTVYEWITRFSKEAVEKAAVHRPQVGDVWVADETVLEIDGKNVWFWDLIDAKTRFLLASHLSRKRTIADAHMLMKKAQIKAGKIPKYILTDKLAAYFEGVERAWGGDTKHIASKGFTVKPNTNLIERFHGTLKARTKVMRGLKDIETARLIMRAWLVHYNYFRPHEALKDKTPAEKAEIKFPYRNWLDIVKRPAQAKPKLRLVDVLDDVDPFPLTPPIRLSKPRRAITPKPKRITPRTPRITPGIMLSEVRGGSRILSRRPIRGARVIKRYSRLLR